MTAQASRGTRPRKTLKQSLAGCQAMAFVVLSSLQRYFYVSWQSPQSPYRTHSITLKPILQTRKQRSGETQRLLKTTQPPQGGAGQKSDSPTSILPPHCAEFVPVLENCRMTSAGLGKKSRTKVFSMRAVQRSHTSY